MLSWLRNRSCLSAAEALSAPEDDLPALAGTSARRSADDAWLAAGALLVEARVAASATVVGVLAAVARQSLFSRRTSATAAARSVDWISSRVGTRNTSPLFSALMLSR